LNNFRISQTFFHHFPNDHPEDELLLPAGWTIKESVVLAEAIKWVKIFINFNDSIALAFSTMTQKSAFMRSQSIMTPKLFPWFSFTFV
jgi:hypothetical protein